MSDTVKLIIEIPKVDYRRMTEDSTFNVHMMITAIQNGIPLPKGHGRLIDEKDLSLMTVHLIDGVFVCDAPTIIEADKESEEKPNE